jgi:hypothetical protein
LIDGFQSAGALHAFKLGVDPGGDHHGVGANALVRERRRSPSQALPISLDKIAL